LAGQLPARCYQKSTPLDAVVLLSIHAFQLPYFVFLRHIVALIAQQQDTKLVPVEKLLMTCGRIRAYSDNSCATFLKLRQLFAKIDRLQSAPARVVLGIEVHDQPFAFEIAQTVVFPPSVRQTERGCRRSYLRISHLRFFQATKCARLFDVFRPCLVRVLTDSTPGLCLSSPEPA